MQEVRYKQPGAKLMRGKKMIHPMNTQIKMGLLVLLLGSHAFGPRDLPHRAAN